MKNEFGKLKTNPFGKISKGPSKASVVKGPKSSKPIKSIAQMKTKIKKAGY